MTSPKGPRAKIAPINATNVDAPSSDLQPTPLEKEGVEGSTAESRLEGDTSQLPQPLKPSGGLGTTTGSQMKTQSAVSAKTLVNDGAPSSGLQSALPEKEGAEGSTTESRLEGDTSQVPQPLKPSGGLDMTTGSQNGTQSTASTKTLVNDGAPSSGSQSEQAGSKDSKSYSKVTSKAPPHAVDNAGLPPSSGKLDSTEPEKILNVGMGSSELPPVPREQVGAENPAAESYSEAEPEKELQRIEPTRTSGNVGALSGDLQAATKGSTAESGAQADTLEASQHNLDIANTSTGLDKTAISPCGDASTSSIKGNTQVNQLPQEPRGTKGASKQKASGIVQVQQENEQHMEDIRGSEAKIRSMETFAQKERGYTEKIERLETKISSLEKIVDQQKREYKEIEPFQATFSTMGDWLFSMVFWLNMEHKSEIERLEGKEEKKIEHLEQKRKEEVERLEGKYEKEVKRLEGKHEEEVKRLEGKHEKEVKRLEGKYEEEIKRLEGKHEKEIQRLEAVVERLQTKISSLEHVAPKQEIERPEGQHKKEIQRLEAVVASMSEQAPKLEKEIGRLQTKVSIEEDAKQLGPREAQDPPKSPDEKLQATKHSANKKINRSAQQPGVKTEPLQIPSPSIKTNIPSPLAVVSKADTLSVTDVANLVKALNADIGQTVNLLTESLSNLEEPATSDNQSEIDFGELRNYLGPGLCDRLEGKFDPSLITQLALQMGLVNACSSFVNDSPFWCNGPILRTIYNRMAEKEGQATADEWRAKASNYLDLPPCEDVSKYLTDVLFKLATAAVGGALESNKSLLSQCNQQLEIIAKSAAKLHKHITEDVTSSELITFTISCDTEFDTSQMEDSENNQRSTPQGKVICTQDMGLLCRKRVGPKKPRGSLKDWGVTTKAKVVLAATLEG